MIRFEKLKVVSAVICVLSGLLLAIVLILGIWLEFQSRVIWKLVGTLFVVFVLSGMLHTVWDAASDRITGYSGCCRAASDKSWQSCNPVGKYVTEFMDQST